MSTIIKVENISKQYRLNTAGSGSLRQDLKKWWVTNVRKEHDSFFHSNIEDSHISARGDRLWALKDVSFNVEEGQILGIVGRNGAGKSTLLKILSRIIKPTTGVVHGRGKISSLLEIGIGFHHELSGRENIYTSGYMLGMKKNDIKSRFDEIVEFSGVSQFLDTPVKRYSSGMYVRLAFAVAAYLEPDILVIDEVLAVGDAEFQRKCIGKMKEVSQSKGRTILFVSHSMQAISNLCTHALLLEKGRIIQNDKTSEVINYYVSQVSRKMWKQTWEDIDAAPGNEYVKVQSVELAPTFVNGSKLIDVRSEIRVVVHFFNYLKLNLSVSLHLFNLLDECIFDVSTESMDFDKGYGEAECVIPGNFLNDGSYYISIMFNKDTSHNIFYFQHCLQFNVEDYREGVSWNDKWPGYVRPKLPFELRHAGPSPENH